MHSSELRRLELFGGYRWRDEERLLVVPLDISQPLHRLLQATTGEIKNITGPATTPFKVAYGEWSVSPDGTKIVFNSGQDGNIWVLEIP